MVTVLKKIEYEATCERCGSELSYTYDDVQENHGTHYIVCPVCNNDDIWVPDPDLTPEIDDGD